MFRAPSSVLLLALVLAAAGAAPASAQHLRAWGVKSGLTLSNLQTELASEDPEFRVGVSGFLFGEWSGSGRASVVAEAGYLQRGYARIVSTQVEDVVMERSLDRPFNYISLAALAKVRIARLGPASTYVVAGPRMNVLVGDRRGEDVPNYDYRSVVWDASVGVGAEGRHTILEIRYSRGLNDALEGEWGEPAYHRALDVVLGLKL